MRRLLVLIPALAWMLAAAPPLVIRNARVLPVTSRAFTGSVVIRDGRIVAMGEKIAEPEGAAVVDAGGEYLMPGIIDPHSHIASESTNEGSISVSSMVEIEDVLDPEDISIYRALAGGVTTAAIMHGSANAIGGQCSTIKMRWGRDARGLLVKGAPPILKMALGENPKRAGAVAALVGGRPPRYPASRMGVEDVIRETFTEARRYRDEWREYEAKRARGEDALAPRRDLKLEPLVEVLDGKRLVHAHCYRADEILMLLRLSDEFGFRIHALIHVLEGYKVAKEIAAHHAGASTFSDWWAYKMEAWDAIPYNAALMAKKGVLVSLNSDDAELMRHLNQEAAKAMKYGGLSETQALELITLNPAKQLGLEKRIGSIEPGKDADLVLFDKHPLSNYAKVQKVWIDGEEYFDRKADLARRQQFEARKKELLEKEKAADKKKEPAAAEKKEPAATADAAPAASPAVRPAEAQAARNGSADRKASRGALERPPRRESLLLRGGTVHTVSGADIPGGDVRVEDGRIVAVGTSLPSRGARVVDCKGLHVYPGMIDSATQMGLTEIGAVRETNDANEIGDFNPQLRAIVAVNPASEHIAVTRANGITSVVTAPRGGLIAGQAALIQLDGWTWEEMALRPAVGMVLRFPVIETRERHFFERPGARKPFKEAKLEYDRRLRQLHEYFEQARRYQKAKAAKAADFETDLKLEAMLPVLDGTLPLVIEAEREREIKEAIRFAGAEKVRAILVGGAEAYNAVKELKAAGIAVVLEPALSLPLEEDDPYDRRYTAAAELQKAGVKFAFGSFATSFARNLPYQAATAIAYGLPYAEGLKAVTLNAAEIWGVAAETGSIEEGKRADLIVTDGDPLETRTQVKRLFIAGREISPDNKQSRLYERYLERQ